LNTHSLFLKVTGIRSWRMKEPLIL